MREGDVMYHPVINYWTDVAADVLDQSRLTASMNHFRAARDNLFSDVKILLVEQGFDPNQVAFVTQRFDLFIFESMGDMHSIPSLGSRHFTAV
jgi:hypothetical protein